MKKAVVFLLACVVGFGAYALEAQAAEVELRYRKFEKEWVSDNGKAQDVTCSQSDEYGANITLTVQFSTGEGYDIDYKHVGQLYFASDSAGDTLVTTSNDPDAVTIATDGTAYLLSAADEARNIYWIRSESDGDWAATVSGIGNKSIYPVFVFENGRSEICPVLDFD